MKGYIACVLALVPALTQASLHMPVHIALSYDEEVGCLGVRSLLASLRARPVKPMLCVIGEPTELQPVLGHKGKVAVRCDVQGASAHAPSGVNAIEYAAQLIGELGRLGEALRAADALDERFDPPFSTIQTGVISGGTALNIVPEQCRFDFEVRALPTLDPQQIVTALHAYAAQKLLPAMQAVSARSEIRFTELSSYPGLDIPLHSQAAELIAGFCGSRAFGTVAFGSEPKAGCSTSQASRQWSADRAAWSRGTSRTSSSASSNLTPVTRCSNVYWRSRRSHESPLISVIQLRAEIR
ncbi:Acetylornithine deacetylase [Pseudomonas amygdali pv. lachrymans]|uniref:Acetylornithine deacetylase n=1 Tax=Pseudomonas amygdali pv. lachrymans TaxID=53707 RepID=A0A0P9TSV4_PSEAV|nr:Acetylornithine deacetylase [Pseudomonas amygdali pv. lachrymans]